MAQLSRTLSDTSRRSRPDFNAFSLKRIGFKANFEKDGRETSESKASKTAKK